MIETNRILPKQRIRFLSFIQQKESLLLGVMLLITIMNGLIFTFVVPPWQHYDEPSNFEYAWLIANKADWPNVGDYDASMRRQVAASMIEHGFFAKGNEPDLNVQEDPVWIGTSQIEDRPFSYWLTSLPLRLFRSASITNQLYIGRLVSMIFYLLTVISAWGIMREITPPGSSLRWVFPTALALMPSLSNLMTSLNSDAGAIGIFSLFLWGSIRLIQRGFSLVTFIIVTGLSILCLFTKVTVYFALPLVGIVLVFTFLRGKRRKWAWTLLILGLFVFGICVVTFDDAANWYRSTTQTGGTRTRSEQSILGEHVLELVPAAVYPSWHRPLFQPLQIQDVLASRGKPVTLGAWIWATEPGVVTEIAFHDGTNIYGKSISLSTTPTFYILPAAIGEGSTRAWVFLGQWSGQDVQVEKVYFDGLVLADGERPPEAPVFSDEKAAGGYWGNREFTNLLRNASGEQRSARFRSWFDRLWSKYLPDYSGPSFNLHYLFDFEGVNWHYRMTAHRLFTTFWGQFGWGHVPLKFGPRPYFLLGVVTVLSILGTIIGLLRRFKSLEWESLLVMGLAALGILVMAVLRGTSHLSVTWLYLPVARYTYPAIIPIMLVFTVGLLELLRAPGRYIRYPANLPNFLFLTFMLLLNVASVSTIVNFYG